MADRLTRYSFAKRPKANTLRPSSAISSQQRLNLTQLALKGFYEALVVRHQPIAARPTVKVQLLDDVFPRFLQLFAKGQFLFVCHIATLGRMTTAMPASAQTCRSRAGKAFWKAG